MNAFNDIETVLFAGEKAYDSMLASLIEENIFLRRGFDFGCWLTRAREGGATEDIPYTGSEIGMRKLEDGTRINLKNRWGKMFYLSTDLGCHSAFNEIGLKEEKPGTLGYFFVNDYLKLFDATEPRGIADYNKKYGELDTESALLVLIALIQKWFNAPSSAEDSEVYRLTNSVARIIRESTKLDGIVFQSTKNNDRNHKSWNVSLINDDKVLWAYSALKKPDSEGRYRETCVVKSDKYCEYIEYTEEFIKLNEQNIYDFPVQLRGVFKHKFP